MPSYRQNGEVGLFCRAKEVVPRSAICSVQREVRNKPLGKTQPNELRPQMAQSELKLNPNQTREKAIERVKAWPKWKREAFSYRKGQA